MTRGARNKIDSIKLLTLIDILQVVRILGNLKALQPFDKHGKFSAICPFHRESNPSFVIFPVSQQYHCYGCGRHGNAISFVRDHLDSDNPIIDLAKLAVKKGWCTWRQLRGRSPSSMVPEHEWRIRDHIVPDYYVAPGCPKFDMYNAPLPEQEEESMDIDWQ